MVLYVKFLLIVQLFTIVFCDHHESPKEGSDPKIAENVAQALTKGLEESLKGCPIDPADPEESLRKCMAQRDQLEVERIHQIVEEGSTVSTEASLSLSDQSESRHYRLLRTALLNLNDQVKNTNGSSDAEIEELLNKIDSVVRLIDAGPVKPKIPESASATIVEVPSEKEIEEAVIKQDYEHHHADFWSTLFSVTDKVALGLLLKIRSVPKDLARLQIHKFLSGSDDDRVQILEDTLNLNKENLDALTQDALSAIKESDFVKYDSKGSAVEDIDVKFELLNKPQPKSGQVEELTVKEPLSPKVAGIKQTHRSGNMLDMPLNIDSLDDSLIHQHTLEAFDIIPEIHEHNPKEEPTIRATLKEESIFDRYFLAFVIAGLALLSLLGIGYHYRYRLRSYAKRNSHGYRRINTKSY